LLLFTLFEASLDYAVARLACFTVSLVAFLAPQKLSLKTIANHVIPTELLGVFD
jgi:hypothetical protein